ncbi:MAG: DUF1330 domain-containing protein [Actinomycetota bacterium]
MAGLWIAHANVTDADSYGEYVKGATEVIGAHGGTFVARGGQYKQCEGADHARNVVVRFDTFDQAVACYESAEYQAIVQTAVDASDRSVVIVEADV